MALLGLLLTLPVAAQTPPPAARGPAGVGIQDGFQMPGVTITVPPRQEDRRDQSDMPAQADEEARTPPDGCRYRENKLDLLV